MASSNFSGLPPIGVNQLPPLVIVSDEHGNSSGAGPASRANRAAKERFQCDHCGQVFKNIRNFQAHHWSLQTPEVSPMAREANAIYEQELRQKAREHLAAEVLNRHYPLPQLAGFSPDSPPLHIVGGAGAGAAADARLDDSDVSFSDSSNAESPDHDPLSHEARHPGLIASTPPRQRHQPAAHRVDPAQLPDPFKRQTLPPLAHYPHPPLEPRKEPARPRKLREPLPPIEHPALPEPKLTDASGNPKPLPSWYHKKA